MLGEPFDRRAEVLIEQRIRPHWSQAGAVVFITFRTLDSLPQAVLRRWERDKQDWLRQRGHGPGDWPVLLPTLPLAEQRAFRRQFARARERELDRGHGNCPLRQADLAQIVADSLLHFDGDRYRLGDFVVMPNHVHLLAAFDAAAMMRKQCDSWLHFTARRINRRLGQSGRFWQQEPFDHLVRNLDQYEYLRTYIAENPRKAGLKTGEFLYRRYAG